MTNQLLVIVHWTLDIYSSAHLSHEFLAINSKPPSPHLGVALSVRDLSPDLVGRARYYHGRRNGIPRLAHLGRLLHAVLSVAQFHRGQVH